MRHITLYVEGIADEVFLEQYLRHLGIQRKYRLVNTQGYTQITSNAILNELQKTWDDGGINLIVYDADDHAETRREELRRWLEREKSYQELDFEYEIFLFPNDSDQGAFEDLLERIIPEKNKPIMQAWTTFEEEIAQITIDGRSLTIPAKKTKIYGYLEVLLGSTHREKIHIKERARDYSNPNHWELNHPALEVLRHFLIKHLAPR